MSAQSRIVVISSTIKENFQKFIATEIHVTTKTGDMISLFVCSR